MPEDVDGDGRILTMRVPDPNGNWKVYGTDRRLMVPRLPEEDEPGPYFRLIREGGIRNYDGVTIAGPHDGFGLDLNRNYPFEWRPEPDQRGAGPYPASEPEVRAAVAAILERPNICASVHVHTMSGVHLRPYCTKSDDALPDHDRLAYEAVGAVATKLTGYPAVLGLSRLPPRSQDGHHRYRRRLGLRPPRGALVGDRALEPPEGGRDHRRRFPDWSISHPVEDDLALLAWSDRELGGRGFVDWYSFEHPQLGPVEIGGWDVATFWTNPPLHRLEAEVAPHTEFALHLALISPRLALRDLLATPLADGLWRIRLVVENTGWLPTNVMQRATERSIVGPVQATISLPDGASAEVLGPPRIDVGQLGGRFLKNSMLQTLVPTSDSTADRAKAEWTVRAPPAGTVVAVEGRRPRAASSAARSCCRGNEPRRLGWI